jgi:hypothetical protein
VILVNTGQPVENYTAYARYSSGPNKKLWLCKDSYIKHLAAYFHLNSLAKWPETLLASSNNLSPNKHQATEAQIKEYQAKISSIQYPAVLTQAGIAYAIGQLSEALKNSSQDHIQAANRVIAYRYVIYFLTIKYSGNTTNKEVVILVSDAAICVKVQAQEYIQNRMTE